MPSWLRRISAGFRTSTVPFTVSIIAPPACKFVRFGDAINLNYRLRDNTYFYAFLHTESKRLASSPSGVSAKDYSRDRKAGEP